MAKYKVISPTGVSIAGVIRKEGETFESETKSAHVQTALHFKQIAPVEDKKAKAAEPEADAKAKAEAEKTKAEAEAKAKAEADAKGGK